MERDRLRLSKAVAAPVEVLLEQWDTDDLVQWAPGIRDLFFHITPSRRRSSHDQWLKPWPRTARQNQKQGGLRLRWSIPLSG